MTINKENHFLFTPEWKKQLDYILYFSTKIKNIVIIFNITVLKNKTILTYFIRFYVQLFFYHSFYIYLKSYPTKIVIILHNRSCYFNSCSRWRVSVTWRSHVPGWSLCLLGSPPCYDNSHCGILLFRRVNTHKIIHYNFYKINVR